MGFEIINNFCRGWKGIALSAVLITLAVYPFNLYGLLFVYMIPAMIGISDLTEKRQKMKLAFLWGGLIAILNFYWLIITIHHFGRMSLWLSFLLFIPMMFYQTAPFIIWLALFKKKQILLPTLLFPILLNFFPFIFPYSVAAFLSESSFFSQIADLTGEWGMDFFIVMVNLLLFQFIINKKGKIYLTTAISVIVLILSYGIYSLSFREFKQSGTLDILLIQPEIRDGDSRKEAEQKFFKIIRESRELAKDRTLIIPESSIPEAVSSRPDFFNVMENLRRSINAERILYNVTVFREGNLYNGEYLSEGNGHSDYYYKTRLMLFGERFPFHWLIKKLPLYAANLANFSPGEKVKPLTTADNIKFATPICLEGIYQEYTAELAENAHIIVNPTNDEWFGHTKATMFHFSQIRLKSIENRKYLVRATNTGYSAILNHKGDIVKDLPRDSQAFTVLTIPLMTQKTIYQEVRNIIPWFFLFSFILAYVLNRFYEKSE